MLCNPSQPLSALPLVRPDRDAADSNMISVERRNLSDVEAAQYFAAFWQVHSYLYGKGHLDRAAWLLSSAHEYANSWLYVSRNSASWFMDRSPLLTDQEFTQCVRSTLLVSPFGQGPDDTRCLCNLMDSTLPVHNPHKEMYHHMDCAAARCFRMYRHQEVCNALSSYVRKRIPDVAVMATPSLHSCKPGVKSIIPDLLITPTLRSGKYIDVTISNPAAKAYCRPTNRSQSSALIMNSTNVFREEEKKKKYSDTIPNIVATNMFVPFAVEATGRLGPRALDYLFELFPKDTRGFSKAVPLIKQISTIVSRHNARASLYVSKGLKRRTTTDVEALW